MALLCGSDPERVRLAPSSQCEQVRAYITCGCSLPTTRQRKSWSSRTKAPSTAAGLRPLQAVSPFRPNMDGHDAESQTMKMDVAPAARFHQLRQRGSVAKGSERRGQIVIGFQPLAEHSAE